MEVEISLYHIPKYEDVSQRVLGYRWERPYKSEVSGPWYDDSDAEFYGETEEEALKAAKDWLLEVQKAMSNPTIHAYKKRFPIDDKHEGQHQVSR